MKSELQNFLKDGKPWEKMATDIDGVFIVKVPGPKSNPEGGARLMIEVNPVDETGKPKKRKGLFISDNDTLIQYIEALNDDRINKVLLTIEEINPPKQETKLKKLKLT